MQAISLGGIPETQQGSRGVRQGGRKQRRVPSASRLLQRSIIRLGTSGTYVDRPRASIIPPTGEGAGAFIHLSHWPRGQLRSREGSRETLQAFGSRAGSRPYWMEGPGGLGRAPTSEEAGMVAQEEEETRIGQREEKGESRGL